MRQSVCIALLLLAVKCWAVDKDVSIETIKSTKRSVVPIICGYNDGKGTFHIVEVAGSGFFVDTSGRFLTAGHVLDNWQEISKKKHVCLPAIYIPDHGWGHYEPTIPFQYFWFT